MGEVFTNTNFDSDGNLHPEKKLNEKCADIQHGDKDEAGTSKKKRLRRRRD